MLNIVIGLLGLGIIITIHEFGHYIVARLCNVEVEVFSIGFGPKLLSRRLANTDFRLSLIPLGGYCRMKGSKEFAQALQEKKDHLEPSEGSFYAATWWKRVCILLAGPVLNIAAALLLYFGLYSVGYTIESLPNKIILVDEIDPSGEVSPAAQAGLQSGDIIVSLDKLPVHSFSDIQEVVSRSSGKELTYIVQRENSTASGTLIPSDVNGQGRIGVYSWVEAIVTNIDANGAAALAGLKNGDKILAANGAPITYSLDLAKELNSVGGQLFVDVLRDNQTYSYELQLDPEKDLGFQLPMVTDTKKSSSVFAACIDSLRTTGSFIALTFQGIAMLFTGAQLDELIAGPGQLIFSIGSISTASPSGFVLSRFIELIAGISIAIAIMNILPIPVTDGGQLIIPVLEAIRTKPLSLRFQQRYQMLGFAIVVFILVIAFWQDFNFFRGL